MKRNRWLNLNWRKIGMVLLIVLFLLALGIPCFLVANFRIRAHYAFREAKNVKLYLRTLDIEYYANGMTIYDGGRPNGLRGGVVDSLENYLDHACDVKLTSYNRTSREVTGFIYTYDNFQVIYRYDDKEGDTWSVNYIFEVMDYE